MHRKITAASHDIKECAVRTQLYVCVGEGGGGHLEAAGNLRLDGGGGLPGHHRGRLHLHVPQLPHEAGRLVVAQKQHTLALGAPQVPVGAAAGKPRSHPSAEADRTPIFMPLQKIEVKPEASQQASRKNLPPNQSRLLRCGKDLDSAASPACRHGRCGPPGGCTATCQWAAPPARPPARPPCTGLLVRHDVNARVSAVHPSRFDCDPGGPIRGEATTGGGQSNPPMICTEDIVLPRQRVQYEPQQARCGRGSGMQMLCCNMVGVVACSSWHLTKWLGKALVVHAYLLIQCTPLLLASVGGGGGGMQVWQRRRRRRLGAETSGDRNAGTRAVSGCHSC